MTLWLVMGGSSGIVGERRINLDEKPCPTITAEGIGVVCIRGWQYWLEEKDEAIPTQSKRPMLGNTNLGS